MLGYWDGVLIGGSSQQVNSAAGATRISYLRAGSRVLEALVSVQPLPARFKHLED
jgi:hypothetical protein